MMFEIGRLYSNNKSMLVRVMEVNNKKDLLSVDSGCFWITGNYIVCVWGRSWEQEGSDYFLY